MSREISPISHVESAPQRQALAANPESSPGLLSRLAADDNLHVRRAAAQNPATPAATLQLLQRAGSTPDLRGARPSASRLSTHEIAELVQLGAWGRRLVAQHPDADTATLTQLAALGSGTLRQLVASHRSCSPALLGELCGDVDARVRRAAAAHPGVPTERLALLCGAGSRADLSGFDENDSAAGDTDFKALIAAGVYGRQLAARHPRIDQENLSRLAEDADWRVRAAVAENPSADGALLATLAGLDTFATQQCIATHAHTPSAVLETLAAEPDVRLRVAVAANPNASPELLRKLALDGSSAVREAVAAHELLADHDRRQLAAAGSAADLQSFVEPDPTLGGGVLAELAQHGGWGQRLAARHPATPTEVLVRLLTSGDPLLRDLAARHPACPATLLEQLVAAGSSADLQGFERAADRLPAAWIESLIELGPWARRLVARHPWASAEHLGRLSHDTDTAVRRAVAKNPSAPAAVTDQMVHDVSHDVRWALVNRADLSVRALSELLGDPIPTIRLAAVEHPNTSADAVKFLRFDLDEDVRAAARVRLDGVRKGDL